MTPAHCAAIEGHREALKVLIDKGADVNARNKVSGDMTVWGMG